MVMNKRGGYEQRRRKKMEQIRSRATPQVIKKELKDNPYLVPPVFRPQIQDDTPENRNGTAGRLQAKPQCVFLR